MAPQPSPTPVSETASIVWDGRSVDIEYRWVGLPAASAEHLLVFLHEGLGSVSMWRDFPQRLCQALRARGLVYSRPGYGQSTPRASDELWKPNFMHRQAQQVLPALLESLGINPAEQRTFLFGHSDGGSIALLAAAAQPDAYSGVVVLAPHIMVEELSLRSIEAARTAYKNTDLRSRLARHHADPDSAFWGWNRIWLDPAFRSWTIEDELQRITCPVLALQGVDDEYGTLAQVHGITRRVANTRVFELSACGHSPHRDQAEAVIRITQEWLKPFDSPLT